MLSEKVFDRKINRQIVLPNFLTYAGVNHAYGDFIHRFVGAINFIAQVKRIRAKPNLDNQIVTVIKSGINYKKFKHSGFETDKDNFEVAKMYLQKMILKKKKF